MGIPSLLNHPHEIIVWSHTSGNKAEGPVPRDSMPGYQQNLGVLSPHPDCWSQDDPFCGGILFLLSLQTSQSPWTRKLACTHQLTRHQHCFPRWHYEQLWEKPDLFVITWFKEIIGLRLEGERCLCECVFVCVHTYLCVCVCVFVYVYHGPLNFSSLLNRSQDSLSRRSAKSLIELNLPHYTCV